MREKPQFSFFEDIPAAIATLTANAESENDETYHFGLISLSLLLIGHGLTDECHNLVTPLSWPDDIHFAHGPSVYHQATPAVQAYASYVHCLVHRNEAFHVGEFGMMGFQNANYWSNAAHRSSAAHELPFSAMRQAVSALCQDKNDKWCERLLPADGSWDSRPVHQLCATVLRDPTNDRLRMFAEDVVKAEIRCLLQETLRRAGFQASDTSQTNVSTDSVTIDSDAAMSAARKVSSAYLDLFKSQARVVFRQVVTSSDGISEAAGLACRMLETPACRLVNTASESSVSFLIEGDDIVVQRGDIAGATCRWEACDSQCATYVDTMFGTRGETPTSVVQWSKGTIF